MDHSKKRIVVVLGMHRSGTSVLARGLRVLNVNLGDKFIPRQADNKNGFWEDMDINNLNEELLATIGSSWHSNKVIEESVLLSQKLKAERVRAVKLLEHKFQNLVPIFGFKDPRTSVLMPFWKSVFKQLELDDSYIIALRSPLDVIKSLERRNGFAKEKSYFLWAKYLINAVQYSKGKPRIVVDYDQLLYAPTTELERISNILALPNPKDQNNELDEYINQFLTKSLRHHMTDASLLEEDFSVPPFISSAYAWLSKLARDEVAFGDVSFDKAWENIAKEYYLFTPVLAYLDQIEVERQTYLDQFNAVVVERDAQLAERDAQLSERDAQLAERDAQLAERDAQIGERNAQLAELYSSTSWRITAPIRFIKNQQLKASHFLSSPLQQLKHFYQLLPLSYQTKSTHRKILAKYFPKLLLASGSHYETIPLPKLPVRLEHPLSKQVTYPTEKIAGSIDIGSSKDPIISVIIPIYGKIDYTLRCLTSISANPPKNAFEVIVVDDCSPDNSAEVLAQVKGIRLVSNTKNQGFIRSCNIGANVALGEYLYFLNNDTEVTSGWMDELLRTFHEFPGTGLAGSKLIYPDGRLQEAGGIIWKDGSAWNFGRMQDPLLPVYNYAREVDYCSGASIMVPKFLFEKLGGFDEYYLPAYCEDSDLALKIRDNGYRVIYQPLSNIFHYEGVTSGTDTSQGVKAHQIENAKKLYERWQNRLQEHQAPGKNVDSAKDRRATRRVLVLDHCTPTPNKDAGSVTVFNLLLLLREMDFQVTFIPEDNFLYMPEYTTALQRVGIEVLYAPYVSSVEQHLKDCSGRYDLAFLFRPGVVERHIKAIRKHCPKAKVLFHTVDLHYLRMSREAELQSDKTKKKAADEMKQRELAAILATDASIVHSTAEFELLRPELPDAKLHVFPLIMDVRETENTFADRHDIVFIGGYQHSPNVDAVQYFVSEIMPILRQRLPGVRFYAVGSKPPTEIQALASEDIIVTGFIENLDQLLDKMRISVAPLRYGAGIKGKIGTAMAVGLPVVATPLAVEGMSLIDGENILVADEAEAFTDAIVRLYQDETLWNLIRESGLKFADNAWGAKAAWKILSTILADVDINTIRSTYSLSLYSESKSPKEKIANMRILKPIASVKSRCELDQVLQSDSLKKIKRLERILLDSTKNDNFTVDGFCVPCNKNVLFLVDMQSGGQRQPNGWQPNWRERLECPQCKMNNRQRLMATLVKNVLSTNKKKHVYLMEQVTPIYNWVVTTFDNHDIMGSEYLGHEYDGGYTINGIRHEDVENLSFSDGELDIIVSNDVFEHVPNPSKAFAECARVLKKGGVMLATLPFHQNEDKSITRAKLINGKLEHILPSVYHGNPVSADGSLVFTDFGWDILDVIKRAGFLEVSVDVYASAELGHLGGGQLVFHAQK